MLDAIAKGDTVLPSLSSLLLKIPDEFKPMAAIGIGSLLLVILVLFHGLGLHRILVRFKRFQVRMQMGRPHLGRAGFLFSWSVFLMLSLHILQITAWAFGLMWLGLILRPADAIYFCANAYTTVGYGTVDLEQHWRNITPIIAICGLFSFAWTTSSLVSILSSYLHLVEQVEQERLQELKMRAAARQAAWDVLHREKALEQAAKLEARKRAAGASFFARWRIRKEEKRHEKDLREAAVAEMKSILQKEHRDEDGLGHTDAPDTPEGRK
ncbi:MAG: potassium channel family protein [Candidatus Korobacteraceae bacterium]